MKTRTYFFSLFMIAVVAGLSLVLRPQPVSAPPPQSAADGAQLYTQHCQACHQANGQGVAGTFPPLAGNSNLQSTDFAISVVLNGLSAPITVNGTQYQGQMPAWGDQLSDDEIAAVLTHERTSWGNNFGAVSAGDVQQIRQNGQKPADLMPSPAATPAPQAGQAPSSFAGQQMSAADIKDTFGSIHLDYPAPSDLYNQGGPFMAAVQRGYLIFIDTQTYAKEYVGDALNCRNCHLNAGSLPYSAPLWAAYPVFPAYRSKNNQVNSFQQRMQGCFVYSMNGTAPPQGSDILVSLEAYSFWLAQGAPTGITLPGRGYGEYDDSKKISSDLTPNLDNGQSLYMDKCALCHGANGQGTAALGGAHTHIPPLWGTGSFTSWMGSEFGPDGPYVGQDGVISFNWGAGMHKVSNMSAFAKYNMPLGQSGTLADQQAVDIAGWVLQDSHQRPIRWSP